MSTIWAPRSGWKRGLWGAVLVVVAIVVVPATGVAAGPPPEVCRIFRNVLGVDVAVFSASEGTWDATADSDKVVVTSTPSGSEAGAFMSLYPTGTLDSVNSCQDLIGVPFTAAGNMCVSATVPGDWGAVYLAPDYARSPQDFIEMMNGSTLLVDMSGFPAFFGIGANGVGSMEISLRRPVDGSCRVEQGWLVPDFDIDIDHYRRMAEAQAEALPDTL